MDEVCKELGAAKSGGGRCDDLVIDHTESSTCNEESSDLREDQRGSMLPRLERKGCWVCEAVIGKRYRHYLARQCVLCTSNAG